jgi:hypothetical protein
MCVRQPMAATGAECGLLRGCGGGGRGHSNVPAPDGAGARARQPLMCLLPKDKRPPDAGYTCRMRLPDPMEAADRPRPIVRWIVALPVHDPPAMGRPSECASRAALDRDLDRAAMRRAPIVSRGAGTRDQDLSRQTVRRLADGSRWAGAAAATALLADAVDATHSLGAGDDNAAAVAGKLAGCAGEGHGDQLRVAMRGCADLAGWAGLVAIGPDAGLAGLTAGAERPRRAAASIGKGPEARRAWFVTCSVGLYQSARAAGSVRQKRRAARTASTLSVRLNQPVWAAVTIREGRGATWTTSTRSIRLNFPIRTALAVRQGRRVGRTGLGWWRR